MNFFKSQLVQGIFNYTLVSVAMILYTWYFLRRNIFPISGCAPGLVYAAGIAIASCTFFGVFDYDWVPCELTAWLAEISLHACILLYTQRAWILLFRFEITENLCLLDQLRRTGASTKKLKKTEGWYLRNRHRIQLAHLIVWFAIDSTLMIILFGITTIYDPKSWHRSCSYSDLSVLTLNVSQYLVALRGLGIMVLAWKLRSKGWDNFMFKNELKWIGIVILAYAVVTEIAALAYPSFPWNIWTGWVAIVATWWPAVLRPLYESYEEEKRNQIPQMDLQNLRSILNRNIGFQSFLEFLTTEFSTENLLCWRDLSEWAEMATASESSSKEKEQNLRTRSISSKVKLYYRAKEISDQYIDEEKATSLINISSTLRSQALSLLESVGLKLSSFEDTSLHAHDIERTDSPSTKSIEFKGISASVSEEVLSIQPNNDFEALIDNYRLLQKSLYDLMNNDSFLRYRRSEFYNQLEKDSKTPSYHSKTFDYLGSEGMENPDTQPVLNNSSPRTEHSRTEHSRTEHSRASSHNENDILLNDVTIELTNEFDVQ